MPIGTLGNVAFEVSIDKIRTFDDFRRRGSARWGIHDVIGKKPVPEFIGPDLEKIRFSMQFSAAHGLNPRVEINKLRDLRDKGEPQELIVGGAPVGENLWIIEELSDHWRRLNNQGALLFAEVDVELKEYPRNTEAGVVTG